jgi:hypothetical protein
MSVFILTTSELEANLENQRMASVLYTRGEGWGGCREGKGEVANHVTTLISWLNKGGEGLTVKSCPEFPIVLILCTTLLLVSLSPISRSAGKPLSI